LPAGKRLRRDPAGLPRRIRPGRITVLMWLTHRDLSKAKL
jgi:hypothetical protein